MPLPFSGDASFFSSFSDDAEVCCSIPSLTAFLTASTKLFSNCLLNSDSTVIVIVLSESFFKRSSNSSRLLVSVLTLIGLSSKYLLTSLRCFTFKFKCSFKSVKPLSSTLTTIGLLLKYLLTSLRCFTFKFKCSFKSVKLSSSTPIFNSISAKLFSTAFAAS